MNQTAEVVCQMSEEKKIVMLATIYQIAVSCNDVHIQQAYVN